MLFNYTKISGLFFAKAFQQAENQEYCDWRKNNACTSLYNSTPADAYRRSH